MDLLRWQGIITMVVLGICGAIAINGDKEVLPMIFLIVGAWLPSPTGISAKPTPPKTAKVADIKHE